MATIVVLFELARGAGAIDPAAVGALARLGVTSIAVVHDEAGIGVVLDGWAFDPASAGQEAAAIVACGRGGVRTLHPLMQAAVSTEQRAPARVATRAGRRSRATANQEEA